MYKLVKATKALSDETRLRMLNLLLQRECCVCEVMQVLKITQTRASRNLSMLYDAGFLNLRKEGLWAYYSIEQKSAENYISPLLEAVKAALKNDPMAVADRKHLNKAERLGPACCSTAPILPGEQR